MQASFVELIRVEPSSATKGHYSATFQARTPEGEFQVTVQFVAHDERIVFRMARARFRRLLAQVASVTNDWSVLPTDPVSENSVPSAAE